MKRPQMQLNHKKRTLKFCQKQKKGRPRGKHSQTELPAQQKSSTATERARPSSSQPNEKQNKGKDVVALSPQVPESAQYLTVAQLVTKMVHVNNMWAQAKMSIAAAYRGENEGGDQ
ncbi:hypothetical protein SESBI_24772 [Sesbania bispinosa]|nr:hypothetical protein SESBI_24772 [Sesbania bispinosa]